MSLLDGFNANEVPKSNAIPEKTQATCAVTKMDDKESTQKPGNWYADTQIQVLDGPYKGMVVFEKFNLKNDNETAVRMARAKLAKLCLAVGVPQPRSYSELMNKPFRATFGKPTDFNGEDQSNIKAFDPVGGSAGVTQNLGQGGAPAAKPAWARPAQEAAAGAAS